MTTAGTTTTNSQRVSSTQTIVLSQSIQTKDPPSDLPKASKPHFSPKRDDAILSTVSKTYSREPNLQGIRDVDHKRPAHNRF